MQYWSERAGDPGPSFFAHSSLPGLRDYEKALTRVTGRFRQTEPETATSFGPGGPANVRGFKAANENGFTARLRPRHRPLHRPERRGLLTHVAATDGSTSLTPESRAIPSPPQDSTVQRESRRRPAATPRVRTDTTDVKPGFLVREVPRI